MSESNLNPVPDPVPNQNQERLNPQQLTEENKESLTESVKRQVAEALEKLRKRVKAFMERGKIMQLAKEPGGKLEILKMIEEYPEDIKAEILNRYAGDIASMFIELGYYHIHSDYNRQFLLQNSLIENFHLLDEKNKFQIIEKTEQILPNVYLKNREIFGFIVKDEEGKDKIKDEKRYIVERKLKEIIKSGDIKTLIRNLDLFEMVGFSTSAINLIMKSDEAVIQEELKTCPEHIRKIYEERFEKRYIKKEYLEKAITGARGKLETAQTEEERKKYEQVIEGLEYLRDWEKNVREHCRKMFEKEGIMPPESVEYWIQRIDEFKIADCKIVKALEINADKLGLTLIEYIAFLQIKLNEAMKRMTMYSIKHPESILDALNPEVGRFIGSRERDENNFRSSTLIWKVKSSKSLGNPFTAGPNRRVMEGGFMGPDYENNLDLREKNLVYGFLNKRNYPNSVREYRDFEKSPDSSEHYGILTVVFDEEIKNKATFSFGDSGENFGIAKRSLLSLVSLPHISSVIYPLSERLYDNAQGEYNPQVTDSETLMLDEDFVINVIRKSTSSDYIEVQYHGITGRPDQIEYVVWYPRSSNIGTTNTEEVAEFIEMRNRIEEYNKQHPERPIRLILASDYHKLRRENNDS